MNTHVCSVMQSRVFTPKKSYMITRLQNTKENIISTKEMKSGNQVWHSSKSSASKVSKETVALLL